MFSFCVVDHIFYNRSLNKQERELINGNLLSEKPIKGKPCTVPIEELNCNADMDYDSDCETGHKNQFRRTSIIQRDRFTAIERPEKRPTPYNKQYVITMFGRTSEGESVAVHVINYLPRFYVHIPEGVNHRDFCNHLFTGIYQRISSKYKRLFTARIEQHVNYYGFSNNKLEDFVCIRFKNSNARRNVKFAIDKMTLRIRGQNIKPEIFEYSIEPYMRFFHDTGLKVVGYISIKKVINRKERLTTCDYEFICLPQHLKNVDNIHIAPLKRLAFDIETAPLESSMSGMPLVNSNDPCICIGCDLIHTRNGDSMANPLMRKKVVFTLNRAFIKEKANEFEIREYGNDERQMILDFVKFIRSESPDIIFTFNGNVYDWHYLYCRAKRLGILRQFCMANKFIHFPARHITQQLSSSALGTMELKFIRTPGIINIDLLDIFNRMNIVDIPDIKLNTVSKYFLDESKNILSTIPEFADKVRANDSSKHIQNFIKNYPQYEQMDDIELYKVIYEYFKERVSKDAAKIDLPYKTMFKYYHAAAKEPNKKENIEKMWFITKYCLQDCTLLHRLVEKCNIVIAYISKANINRFPFGMLFYRGTGPLIYSAVTERTQKRNYVCPEVKEETFDSILANRPELAAQYEAIKHNKKEANVFKKKVMKSTSVTGAQVFDPIFGQYENVATLDVKSEYPSIMRAFNISHDTIVLDMEKYGNLPGIRYLDLKWNTIDGKEYWARYVLDLPDRKHRQGVLPEALDYYVSEREKVKAKMKTFPEGSVERVICNAEQNELKIISNAIYGQTTFRMSKLFLKALGGCTTATARAYLMTCKRIVESTFEGAKIIYGDTDSIFVKFHSSKLTPRERFFDVWDQAERAKDMINKLFEEKGLGYLKIELEKVFSKLVLFNAKKRYYGNIHLGRNYEKSKSIVMGVTAKKRNVTEIEKFVARVVMDLFILDRKDEIIPFIYAVCRAIYQGKFEFDYFKKSNVIKKTKYVTAVPQGVALEKIRMYDPGNEVKLNEKVYYFYARIPHAKKRSEQVHPADYVQFLPEEYRVIDYKIYIGYFIKIIENILKMLINEDAETYTKMLVAKFENVHASNDGFPKIKV